MSGAPQPFQRKGVRKIVRDLFTEDDAGTIWDLVRFSGAGGVVTFLGNSVWTGIHNGTVDLQSFGIGFAALLGGLGAAMGARAAGEAHASKVNEPPPTTKGE